MRFPLILALSAHITFTNSEAVRRNTYLDDYSPGSLPHTTRLYSRAIDTAAEREKAWCKGSKLSLGMIKPESLASTFISPVRSPWDGDLRDSFAKWGYREIPGHRDDLCDFGPDQHNIARAFKDLGIETGSARDGGPNQCFHIEHKYGPTVEMDKEGKWPEVKDQWYRADGRKLRETEAFTTLGINVPSGALYFFNRLSPREAAHENWGIPYPQIQQQFLPDLSSSSDHAWGFWTRTHASGDLANIKYILMCMITNDVTNALIAEALRTYPLPPGTKEEDRPRGVEKWPGTTFEMHYDAAQVLLGSPNGQAAGYFLAQHKHRFGKSKTIDKVTVFRPGRGIMPYLLFWIIDAPAASTFAKMNEEDKGVVDVDSKQRADSVRGETEKKKYTLEKTTMRQGGNGKNMLREHVFRAGL